MPPDLFPVEPLQVKRPAGQREPRFWVRRLTLWEDRETLIRDVPLRPGVNVVWSPPMPTSGDGASGHGSGKTTFCRMIRYCLGEPRYGPDSFRSSVSAAFPDGFAATEVIIDGTTWVAIRPFGTGISRALRAENTEEAIARAPGREFETLTEPITDAFLSALQDPFETAANTTRIWEAALAWLTRDQECRLHHLYDWRSSQTQTGSIAQTLSVESKTALVRLALGAMASDELALQSQIEQLATNSESLYRKIEVSEGIVARLFEDLLNGGVATDQDDPLNSLSRQGIITRARTAYRDLLGSKNGPHPDTGLSGRRRALEQERDRLRDEKAEAEKSLALAEAELPRLEGERVGVIETMEDGVARVCPVCRVTIDKVLAEGCGVSVEQCDLEAARNRIETLDSRIADCMGQISADKSTIDKIDHKLEAIDSSRADLNREFERREQALSDGESKISLAREVLADATRLDQIAQECDSLRSTRTQTDEQLKLDREAMKSLRGQAQKTLDDFLTSFQQCIAIVMPSGVEGTIELDGNGFRAILKYSQRGGSLDTAALDSLKIVAFDFAALISATEGRASVPAFWIHDSPREADLDQTLYSRIFSLACAMEKDGTPLFQYIISTTTEPPELAATAVILKLSSGDSGERLFRRDL